MNVEPVRWLKWDDWWVMRHWLWCLCEWDNRNVCAGSTVLWWSQQTVHIWNAFRFFPLFSYTFGHIVEYVLRIECGNFRIELPDAQSFNTFLVFTHETTWYYGYNIKPNIKVIKCKIDWSDDWMLREIFFLCYSITNILKSKY